MHVKDDGGSDTFDAQLTATAITAVRDSAPGLPVGLTTGAWAEPDPDARVAAIQTWTVLPDFASVNWHEDGAENVATCLLNRGIAVEAGLWHADAISRWLAWPWRDQCLRILLELPADLPAAAVPAYADTLLRMLDPAKTPILLHGEDRSCWPALAHAAYRGLATRIGLEDTLLNRDDSPAIDNATLVSAAHTLLRRKGRL